MYFTSIMLVGSLLYNFGHWINWTGNYKIEQVARAYYISPSGSDANAGTRNAPFQSVKRLITQQFNPGDSILFEGGRQFKGNLTLHMAKWGDQQHPILVSSFGNGYASLNAGRESGIEIKEARWVMIKKLNLIGSGRKKGNLRNGLYITNSHYIIVDSLNITGFQKSGLSVDFSSDISLKHIISYENGFAGIFVGTGVSKKSNHNIYIGYCRAENNPGDPSNLNNHSGNGIVVSACTNVLIEYCTATNNGWDMPRKGNGPVGIWAFEADSVVIQHCLSYRNKTSVGGADGGGFDLDGGVTHSIVQYCLSYENQGAGYCLFQYLYASPWHDNIFRYNISENDGAVSDAHGGVYIWNSAKLPDQFYNGRFYNNTIYNAKGTAIRYSELSERKNFTFYNNIFVVRDSLDKSQAVRDVFSGNDWWGLNHLTQSVNKNELESANHELGKDKHPVNPKLINLNPEFRIAGKAGLTSASGIKKFNHYKIPAHSPLRKIGLNLESIYGINDGGLDFNSQKAPANGIGACF
jgi:Right handed beta helix region